MVHDSHVRQRTATWEGTLGEVQGKETEVLDGLLYHPRTKAARTHANAFGGAIDHRADILKIRSEDPVGLIVGMTDSMSGLMTLAANLTYKSHDRHSFSRRFVVLKTSAMLP